MKKVHWTYRVTVYTVAPGHDTVICRRRFRNKKSAIDYLKHKEIFIKKK